MSIRLRVANLSPRTTARQLARFFSSAGIQVSAEIPVDRETGLPRGYGFVELESEELAKRALLVFDGRQLGNRELRLERAADGGGEERGARASRSGGGSGQSAGPRGLRSR